MTDDTNNYCLSFKQFESSIASSWQELQEYNEFYDVSLACEDQLILSHKIVISSRSPVLRNILKQNTSQHPVIYLKGVRYQHLQQLLNFIYRGECYIATEDIESFMEVAEDLKIIGLSGKNNDRKILNPEINMQSDQTEIESSPKGKCVQQESFIDFKDKIIFNAVTPILEGQQNMKEDKDNQYKPETKSVLCDQDLGEIKYENYTDNLLSAKEFSCDKCDKHYARIDGLQRHKESAHDGINYPCNQCDYTGTTKRGLKLHIDSTHKHIFSYCDQCDKKYTEPGNLKKHKTSSHDGIRFPCTQCDYKAAQKVGLIKHIKNVHNKQT